MSFNDPSSSSSAPKFKSFVSEAEIEERKKKRQEEWEKVRKPDQPVEAPEEEYDSRSLFEKLQEQKDRKQADYEEAHKLKNLIRGLDDDEVSFLELVDKTKLEMENRILKEEIQELNEYRKAVASFSEETAAARLQELKKSVIGETQKRSKQQETLLKAVKRKSSTSGEKSLDNSNSENKQRKLSETIPSARNGEPSSTNRSGLVQTSQQQSGVLRCIGVLPGLGVYSDSSESENSSGSESEPDLDVAFDLVGRPRRVIHSHNNA